MNAFFVEISDYLLVYDVYFVCRFISIAHSVQHYSGTGFSFELITRYRFLDLLENY